MDNTSEDKTFELPVEPGEAWTDAALADYQSLPKSEAAVWIALFNHCSDANGSSPSKKWMASAQTITKKLNERCFSEFVCRWFPLTAKKRTAPSNERKWWVLDCCLSMIDRHQTELLAQLPLLKRFKHALLPIRGAISASEDPWAYMRAFSKQPEVVRLFGENRMTFNLPDAPPPQPYPDDHVIKSGHQDILQGLAWTCSLFQTSEVARALMQLATSCYRKEPGIGPRAVRVGNACVTALGMMGTPDALGQLALLKVRVKFGGAQAAIDKALNKLAEKLGVQRDDLEEMSVPSYGMTEVGCLTQEIGEFTAELRIIDSRRTELAWKRADGKPQKSLPATVKQEHAEEVKELMGAKKDIEKMLPAQSERLDNLYLQRKSWPLAVWRERYLDHPLVGALARRLIWNFTRNGTATPGLWLNGQLVDRSANPLVLDEQTTVTLWHPLDQVPDAVLGWHGFLEEWEITQPFKQAHREVYLLTPAEEQTRLYSNRFAAHLLRQHQFNALCAARGWKNRLRLAVDDEYPPATRKLHAWNLRAEYWIEGAGDELLESGAYRYVSTDQVRFYTLDAAQCTAHASGGGYGPGYRPGYLPQATVEPLLLADIPPLVFSEIMRDVDLFVGVASVGNDPNWLDGGTNEGHRRYWLNVSFGELNATAQTRKTILERLVPKLKIAKQCSFADKFLVIAGKRHAYKIHLGSGNILIAPQDKYLCIVPAQAQVDKAGEKLFLPFEGDRVLSVILSKAFLLAADDKITDETILRQLA
jgi:hypothetical protein